VSPSVQTIGAGVTFYYELEFCPVAELDTTCLYTVQGPCCRAQGELCYRSVEVPDCAYYDICITSNDECKPDCIKPNTMLTFNIGGSIDPALYPVTITFQVVDQSDMSIIFTQDYLINNDVELDALAPSFFVEHPGRYCAEVCIPGCDTKKIFCFEVCDPFDIYKDDCNKYHIFRPHECGPQKYKVTVTELEGDVIIEDDEWDVAITSTYDFVVPGDGIYIVEMNDFTSGATIYKFAIFETCELERCFKILMDKIMCSCADPCCKKCNGTPQKEIEFGRITLNKLNPLYLTYLGMAHKWRVDSIGTAIIPEDTECFLYTASQVYGKIREILETCDCLCKEEKSTASSRGDCKSC